MIICKCDKCGNIVTLPDSEQVHVQGKRYDLCKNCIKNVMQELENDDLFKTYEQILKEIKEIAFSPAGLESAAMLEIRDILNGENLE